MHRKLVFLATCLLLVHGVQCFREFPNNALPPVDYTGPRKIDASEPSANEAKADPSSFAKFRTHSSKTHDYYAGTFESDAAIKEYLQFIRGAFIVGTIGELDNVYLVAFPIGTQLPAPPQPKDDEAWAAHQLNRFWEPMVATQQERKMVFPDPGYTKQLHLVSNSSLLETSNGFHWLHFADT
jgi:hypothetical protein